MAYKPLLPSTDDIKLWGRFVRGYSGAFGSGTPPEDPDPGIGIDGHLWMMVPLKAWEMHDLMATALPQVEIEPESLVDQLFIHLKGNKLKRGLLSRPRWGGSVTYLAGRLEFDVGFLAAREVRVFFESFDRWRAGEWPLSTNFDAAYERA